MEVTVMQLVLLDPGSRLSRPARPYRIEALQEAAGLPTDGALAERIGVGRTMVQKRRQRDGLSFWEADRWAIACGLLPHEVWPEWEIDPTALFAELEAVAS